MDGSHGSGTSSGDEMNEAPRIDGLSVSALVLTDATAITLDANVVDPNGDALIGTVRANGTELTTFSETASGYSATLEWHDVASALAPSFVGTDERMLTVTFADPSGETASTTRTITLQCGSGSEHDAACAGTCTDLRGPTTCGACNNDCGRDVCMTLSDGLQCQPAYREAITGWLCLDMQASTPATCDEICGAQGSICSPSCVGGQVARIEGAATCDTGALVPVPEATLNCFDFLGSIPLGSSFACCCA